MSTPRPGTNVCPECGARVPLRLGPGEVCPGCDSAMAWASYGEGGKRLVIRRSDIEESVRRRAAGPRRTGLLPWALQGALLASSLAAAGAGALWCLEIWRPRELGPLTEVQGELARVSRMATIFSAGSLVLGLLSFLLLKRGSRFRSIPLLAAHLPAVVIASVLAVLGGVRWFTAAHGFGWEHSGMPSLDPAPFTSPWVRSAMEATAVILATMEDGNASWPAIGAGAVIAAQPRKAWIVTSSHVAMPYAAVGAWRDAAAALPVWVYLSSGESARGHVRWAAPPPLDVAVLEVPAENPPGPIRISRESDLVQRGEEVFFVPNPFRSGWKFHRGSVKKREPHQTPAGEYSLLYTDLPVQPGDSGSGLFDKSGRLVGLNTWLQQGGGESQGIGLPSETMVAILDLIERNELEKLDRLLPGGGPR